MTANDLTAAGGPAAVATGDRADELALGIDTGGTFTDAVLLAGGSRVVAAAKALTTHWDLALGIGNAIRAVLAERPAQLRGPLSLVCVSTTLATNAVVENRFSPVCTLLIGFDDAMAARAGLQRQGAGHVVRVAGGHGATGEESAPLDEEGVLRAVEEFGSRVEAFAVAGNFSVRNPAHELRVRELIRAHSPKPVTCAHELSSKLDAPRRALTAALNARLTPQIRHLIEALGGVLEDLGIAAPLMIVKGDGSLMKAEIALEYPVETVLSGPAASVVGAGFLTGLADFVVSDMGGTTTDIAIVSGGRPVISAEGALVGGWRTMVEAVDVRTSGLGGDSEVGFDRGSRLRSARARPCRSACSRTSFPRCSASCAVSPTCSACPTMPTHFAFRNPERTAPPHLSALERRVWDSLALEPAEVSHDRAQCTRGSRRCGGLPTPGSRPLRHSRPATPCTCSAASTAGAARRPSCGARILPIEERNALALRAARRPSDLRTDPRIRAARNGPSCSSPRRSRTIPASRLARAAGARSANGSSRAIRNRNQ